MKATGTQGNCQNGVVCNSRISVLLAREIRSALDKFEIFNESFDFLTGELVFLASLLLSSKDQVKKVSIPC